MANSELLLKLLEKRGVKNYEQIDIFLNPNYERDFLDPFLMRDMEKACVRLYEAIENKEKIIIYADYDCDGIPGAVIITDFLKKINYSNYEVYIPQRNSEGYGLNLEAIEIFAKNKVKLLITIDLGITAIKEVAQAEVDGIDIIITDHHLPKINLKASAQINYLTSSSLSLKNSFAEDAFMLPRAYAILNPKVDNYSEKMLCGAGVMFKFMQGMVKKYGEFYKINEGWEKWMLDMAGLATMSDMVPLLGENRAMAYFGMKVFRKSPRPGLQKLLAKMKIDQQYISEDDIGFMVTPRLNAASRMDDPMRAYELLSTIDDVEAGILADHLSKINDERKDIVKNIMREVKKKLEKFEKINTDEIKEVIVIGNITWKVGILGLVAGKICDEYDRPVFVWGKDENDMIKGSCRSNGSVSLIELMTETKESFLEFGGHELAGGFTVLNEKIHFLEEALSLSFHKVKKIKEENLVDFDIQANLNLVDMKNWKEIDKMAPFGLSNQKPIFLFSGVKIEKIKKFGKNGSGEHLEIVFSDQTKKNVIGVKFFAGLGSFKTPIEEGKNVNLLATFDLSRFRGRVELRLRIEDIY